MPSDPRWNLDELYASSASPRLLADLATAETQAGALAAELSRGLPVARDFYALLAKLDGLLRLAAKLKTYAALRCAQDAADEDASALRQRVDERLAVLEVIDARLNTLLAGLGADAFESLAAAPGVSCLGGLGHVLRRRRESGRHVLPLEQEALLADLAQPLREGWKRLYDKTLAAVSVDTGEPGDSGGIGGVPLAEVLARLRAPDRQTRVRAAGAVSQALTPCLPTLAQALNALLRERAVQDERRGHASWIDERLARNETSRAALDAMLEAVESRRDLYRRYHDFKRRLLGLEILEDADRYAPVASPGAERRLEWAEAVSAVRAAFTRLGGWAGDAASVLLAEGRVDAFPRRGKAGGAFAHPGTPDGAPFLLVNFTGDVRDVLVLAHEAGHGLHALMSGRQPMLSREPSLFLAEVPALLAETLAVRELLAAASAPGERLALICRRLEDGLMTVFRQASLHRVEEALHRYRREQGELSLETLARLWREPQEALAGDSIVFTPGYSGWWALVLHFFHFPGYVHGYAQAELVAQALEVQLQNARGISVPAGFGRRFAALLAAGASASPGELLAEFGIDLERPDVYHAGLDRLEAMFAEAERIAKEAGRVVE